LPTAEASWWTVEGRTLSTRLAIKTAEHLTWGLRDTAIRDGISNTN